MDKINQPIRHKNFKDLGIGPYIVFTVRDGLRAWWIRKAQTNESQQESGHKTHHMSRLKHVVKWLLTLYYPDIYPAEF